MSQPKIVHPSSFLIVAMFISLSASSAWADIKQVKAYKEAFSGEKPNCACCHVSDKPKKEDGMHDLNDYGKKVVAINPVPDASTYKTAGKNES